MNTLEIEQYLESNQSKVIGKYRFHSCYKSKPLEYKFRFYYRDEGFREIVVYVTIDCSQDELEYEFSVDLNEQEKKYIINESLKRILVFMQHKSILHSHMYDLYIRNKNPYPLLETQDYRNILDYIQYLDGFSQEGVDTFYFFFMPYLKYLLDNKDYPGFLKAFELVLERANDEESWIGANTKYLDTQCHIHKKHIFKILDMIIENFDSIATISPSELSRIFVELFVNKRFGLEVVVGYQLTGEVKLKVRDFFEEYGEPNWDSTNIAVRLLLSSLSDIKVGYYNTLLEVLRFIMVDVTQYANHESQIYLAQNIINKHGHSLLIDIFKEDYNTFVFDCFKISSFPNKYRLLIKKELENAALHLIAEAEDGNDSPYLVEEVFSIYRLLLENYEGA